ncbi:unnamed protein product [marine sediment metagenome]|uniref:Uncharacterized protein n=1 Tax=marine sediment metagenome TaxID=412755 RepID=X1QMU0_9ZZZZ
MIALEVESRSTRNLQALAASVPIGQRGLVHIWGRNDTPVTQDLGVSWVVRDPNGIVVEEYSDWSYGHGPGDDHEFIGGRFDLNKEGTYTLKADLLMGSPDNPVIVDSYQGDLCTTTTEVPPEYVLIQHTIYPWSYLYEGDAETCTFEFKLTPEQIPGTAWLGQRIVDSFVSELEKEGSRLLELKVYEDTTPTWWTNYRVEVTATASPIVWTPIIIGVLAILFIVAIYFTIKLVDEVFFKRKALDEETKKTFSRETLTAMILDLAPETPPETLEGMEDQELRDLLNRLLAEAAPPISPWLILGIVGGLGVLGVGAAVALSAARPRRE